MAEKLCKEQQIGGQGGQNTTEAANVSTSKSMQQELN